MAIQSANIGNTIGKGVSRAQHDDSDVTYGVRTGLHAKVGRFPRAPASQQVTAVVDQAMAATGEKVERTALRSGANRVIDGLAKQLEIPQYP